MKWIAIDIGNSEIKVAVRGERNKPSKLLYDSHGRLYSHLTPEYYLTPDKKPCFGCYLPIMGALHPENIHLIKDPLLVENDSSLADDALNALFGMIKEAAITHYAKYNDASIAAVLLHDNIVDEHMAEIAQSHFTDVQNMFASEVLCSIHSKNKEKVLVVDMGMSSLKTSIITKGVKDAFSRHDEMGFYSVDMSEIIGYNSSEDKFQHGLLLEKSRADLCQDDIQNLPIDCLNSESNPIEIKSAFENNMQKFLYDCFDMCEQDLRNLSLKWEDTDAIIFCGGASNYFHLEDTFQKYLDEKDCHLSNDHIIRFHQDAQWAAAFATLQMPLLNKKDIVVDN